MASPFNLATYCLGDARTRPDASAAVFLRQGCPEEVWTFGRLAAGVEAMAAGLRGHGLRSGERILLRLPTGSELALLFLAAVRAGMVPVMASPMLTRAEVAVLAETVGAAVLVQIDEPHGGDGSPRPPPAIAPAAIAGAGRAGQPLSTDAEDPAFLISTSGTGGRPKVVLHAQRTVLGRRPMRAHWQGFGPRDRVLHAGQLNWTYTLGVGLLDPLAAGATAILHGGPVEPAAWVELIERQRVTVFAAVPTVFRQILKYGDPERLRHSGLRHALCAGEALPPDLYHAWIQASGRPLYEALGMSEISTYISSGPCTPVRPGSPGRPQPGRKVAILPETGGLEPLPPGHVGLLAVHRSDPGLMLGYWQDPDATAAAMRGPWFVGGDRAAFDADGYVWFHGRPDEVLNCQGYRVSALEVEQVLGGHPEVSEVAVGVTTRDDGVELMTAYVVAPGEPPDAEALRTWVADRLAAYKCPQRFRFVAALPRTRTGKLMRAGLEEAAASSVSHRR